MLKANTIKSAKSGKWSSPSTWDANAVPSSSDNVMISTNDTVYIDVDDLHADCNNLLINGSLILAYDSVKNHTGIYIWDSLKISKTGEILLPPKTPSSKSYYHTITVSGGGIINNGRFIGGTKSNDFGIYLNLYGKNIISGNSIFVDLFSPYGKSVVMDTVNCQRLTFADTLDLSSGIVKIEDNGSIYREGGGVINRSPIFGKNIQVYYENTIKDSIITGPELPSEAAGIYFDKNITLTKNLFVRTYIGLPYNLKGSLKLFTSNYTLTLGTGFGTSPNLLSSVFIIGNLARVFTSVDKYNMKKDSLIFPLATIKQFRPIAIKLNNATADKDTITLSINKSSVTTNNLLQNLAAINNQFHWTIKASSNYNNVDANVSLSLNKSDYIKNPALAAVVQSSDYASSIWNTSNNNIRYGEIVYNDSLKYQTVTASFKSFGDFTTGEVFDIPNNGFEFWSSPKAPEGWTKQDTALGTIFKDTNNVHSGLYSLKGIVADSSGINIAPKLSFTVPFKKKFSQLFGYYEFNSQGSDVFSIDVKFIKNGIVTGDGLYEDSLNVNSFQNFSDEIKYDSAFGQPDSLSILISIKPGDKNSLHSGSKFWIDDLSLNKTTGVREQSTVMPVKSELFQNYPNPFNPTTKIKFTIPKAGNVNLAVYNILGQKIRELINGFIQAGKHSFEFNGNNLSSGIYFYRLKENGHALIRKMILLK